MPNNERQPIPDSLREQLLREAGYKCGVPTCQVQLILQLHHILHVSEGGGNDAANLIAVCANCHALYHHHHEDRQALRQWKARLLALNAPGQQYFTNAAGDKLQGEVEQMKAAQVALTSERLGGFHQTIPEFIRRACQIGFLYGPGNELFVTTGYGTFVDKATVLTAGNVLDLTVSAAQKRNGLLAVWTEIGMSTCIPKTRFAWGDHVLLSLTEVDDSRFSLIEDATERAEMISRLRPLETLFELEAWRILGKKSHFLMHRTIRRTHAGRSDFKWSVHTFLISFEQNRRVFPMQS